MKYYQILNLPHDCSQYEIKKRYHELALRYHPDKNSETNIEFLELIKSAVFSEKVLSRIKLFCVGVCHIRSPFSIPTALISPIELLK